MVIDFDRLDIHMGDDHRARTFEVDESCTLRDVLGVLLPQLPAISEGWVIRAQIAGEWGDVATSGPRNTRLELLTPDGPIATLTDADTFFLAGVPTYEHHRT